MDMSSADLATYLRAQRAHRRWHFWLALHVVLAAGALAVAVVVTLPVATALWFVGLGLGHADRLQRFVRVLQALRRAGRCRRAHGKCVAGEHPTNRTGRRRSQRLKVAGIRAGGGGAARLSYWRSA